MSSFALNSSSCMGRERALGCVNVPLQKDCFLKGCGHFSFCVSKKIALRVPISNALGASCVISSRLRCGAGHALGIPLR